MAEEKKKKKRHRVYEGENIASFTDLSIGDYVVHENHGLGIYRGLEKIVVDRVEKDGETRTYYNVVAEEVDFCESVKK